MKDIILTIDGTEFTQMCDIGPLNAQDFKPVTPPWPPIEIGDEGEFVMNDGRKVYFRVTEVKT